MLAYIDPNSGSFLLQAIVATLAGGAVAVGSYWRRLKQRIGRSPRPEGDPAEKPRPPSQEA